MMHTFKTVDTLVTGLDCFDQLGELAKPLGTRALLVTGRHAMRKAGVTSRAAKLLKKAGVDVRLFEEITDEPTTDEVDAGRTLCREEHCDLVIGLGGGSPMDAAKSIAALAHADAPTAEYLAGRAADAERLLPCIEVPTTSGTGSEVTPNAVLTDPAGQVKKSIRGKGLTPRVALVDPRLTVTCPPPVTAASGMDALTQAVESFVSIHATPITAALSFRAATLLFRHLPVAVDDGDNLPAREACAYGSVMAGVALANARLGVVHGIAHPLGARYHIPHGVCCAVLLPASIRLNRGAAHEKYEELSVMAGGDVEDVVESMLDRFGIPRTFAAYHIDRGDFEVMTKESMPSGSLKANPKTITEGDVIQILEQAAG